MHLEGKKHREREAVQGAENGIKQEQPKKLKEVQEDAHAKSALRESIDSLSWWRSEGKESFQNQIGEHCYGILVNQKA